MRAARWVVALVALACSSAPQPSSPNNASTADAGPSGPFDITIASSPPIDLPGIALWLDPDYGVAREATQVRAWTDRSGHGHVLERQAVSDAGPSADRLAGHGALRFEGHARLVLSATIEDQARAALTIGDEDFLIALVVRKDGGSPQPTFFALAPPQTPDVVEAPLALLSLQPALQLVLADTGSHNLLTTAAALDSAPHVLVVASVGPRLVARVDGQEVGMRPFGRLAGEHMDATPISLPFLAPFVGAWDFDLAGWSGLIGDVVVVVGPGVAGATPPLEEYLRKKYGL